jgi:hypothetical protein
MRACGFLAQGIRTPIRGQRTLVGRRPEG